MSRTSLRLAAVALAAAPALLAGASPAAAAPGDSFFSRTTGFAGSTTWVQYYDFANPAFGNVHVGDLYAYETAPGKADVFSFIADYECAAGVFPTSDPHGGTQDNGCAFLGNRQLEGQGITFTVGRRGASASLVGQLTASTAGDPHTGEGGTTLGQVPADFTWTATADPVRSSSTFRYREGGTTYSDTFRTTSRTTAMTGVLGPMLFQEAQSASGRLESFRSTSRSRS